MNRNTKAKETVSYVEQSRKDHEARIRAKIFYFVGLINLAMIFFSQQFVATIKIDTTINENMFTQ